MFTLLFVALALASLLSTELVRRLVPSLGLTALGLASGMLFVFFATGQFS